MSFVTVNPANGRRLRSYREHSAAEVERALHLSQAAFRRWSGRSFTQRATLLQAVARLLREQAPTLAALATQEMGKPRAQADAEIEKCALGCEFFARHARGFLAEEFPAHGPRGASVVFEPLGPVLAVMPWNFPFWQVCRAAAPILMAGNTLLLKHAVNVTGCALAIADVFAEAGLPRGVFQTLLLGTDRVTALVADRRVRAVTLTGSTGAGRAVAAAAGAAMKKGVFELGGSDAYVVLEDADLDRAAEICAQSRLINSGQSCVCAKRFIAVRPVLRAFEDALVARMGVRRVGPPDDPASDLGPLARRDLRDHLHAQVAASVARGAKVRLGGQPLRGPGNYYPPTVLTRVTKGMPAYEEELFGPVAAVIAARDEDHAVAIANDSPYGLGAAVFSRRPARARAVARRLQAGVVFINDFVRSEPALPFGGVKDSGYGRELGAWGIREFVSPKTLVVK
jgi:succinate-semialdehyde dehydrogenase/glutarate-semialdehyde dehydrogenase